MHHPWHDLALPDDLGGPIPAVIEIPTDSKVKYEIDKSSGMLLVDRILHSAVHYPANYGFVPRTYCGDGDPIDILVLCREPVAPFSLMRARIVGVMRMRDDKGEDDKLIAVAADDPAYEGAEDIRDVPRHLLLELRQFFHDYKRLERREVTTETPLGRDAAIQILRDAVNSYSEQRKRLLAKHPVEPPRPPPVPKVKLRSRKRR